MWKIDLSSFLRQSPKEPSMASDKSCANLALHRNVHLWDFHLAIIPPSSGKFAHTSLHHLWLQHPSHVPHGCLSPLGACAFPGGKVFTWQTASFAVLSSLLPLPSSPAAGPGFSSRFSHYQALETSLPAGVLDIFHKGTNTFKSIHPQSCQQVWYKYTSLSQLWRVLSSPTMFRLCDTACDSSFLNYSP